LNTRPAGENANVPPRGLAVATAVAVSLPVLGAAGCGQSDDREAVRATTQQFLAAYAADRDEAACQTLSSDTVKELESQEGAPCPEAIGKVELDGGNVAQVEVSVTNAKVDLGTGESVFLSEQADGWKITALGCRSAGKPADEPFDCELTA
jgi:hypothetical protein